MPTTEEIDEVFEENADPVKGIIDRECWYFQFTKEKSCKGALKFYYLRVPKNELGTSTCVCFCEYHKKDHSKKWPSQIKELSVQDVFYIRINYEKC